MDPKLRVVHPAGPAAGGDVDVAVAYAGPLGGPTDRPWLALCMVSSIDGSTVVDGTSSALSSPTDSAVLLQLRRVADVIVVGAGTVRAEGYGPPGKPGQRVGVVTASGAVDLTRPLFTSGAGFVITTSRTPIGDGADVIRAGHDTVDLAGALRAIPQLVPGCRVVQAEGGAALNASLLDADVIDEINLTTSPAAVGGHGPRLAAGASSTVRRFEIAQLAIDAQSFVYARWLRRR